MRADNNKKSKSHPEYIDAVTGKPVMSKEDARTVLSLLHQMPSEKIDMGLVDICLAIMGDGLAFQDRVNVRQAVKTFKKRLAQRKAEERASGRASGHLSKRMVVALVLIGCLLLAAVCYALGWLPWIKTIQWDAEQYHYNIIMTEEMAGDPYTQFYPTGLAAALDQTLEEYGINIPLPTWIPDGYDVLSYEVVDLEYSVNVYISLFKEDNLLAIDVTKYRGIDEVYTKGTIEKDEEYFEEYRKGETVYTIMSNIGYLVTSWMEQPYECTIGGYVSVDDMHRMIDSIYERELLCATSVPAFASGKIIHLADTMIIADDTELTGLSYAEIAGDAEMKAEPYTEFLATGLDEEFDWILRHKEFYIPLPTWLPERFKMYDIYFEELEASDLIFFSLEADETPDQRVNISVEKFSFNSEMVSESLYQNDGLIFEKYTVGETTYTIYSNQDTIGALWFVRPYQCSIIGHVSLEEMYQILDSIGERETRNE